MSTPRAASPAALPKIRVAAVVVAAVFVSACGESTEEAVAPPVAPAAEGEALLMRLVDAENRELFSGWKTVWNGPPAESRRSTLHVRRFEGRKNLVTFGDSVDNPAEGGVWTYQSRHRWIQDPDLLLSNYDVQEAMGDGETESVAWRETYCVRVTGRRSGRPSLEILVDRETDLPVSETLRDHAGEVIFAWRFDSIEYGPPEMPAETAAAELADPERLTDPSAAGGQIDDAGGCDWPALLIGDSPSGFRRVSCKLDPGGELREYWSDGLAAFFVAQVPIDDGDESEEGVLERRECGGRAAVTGVIGDVRITISGTLPVADLERLARDLRVPSSLE